MKILMPFLLLLHLRTFAQSETIKKVKWHWEQATKQDTSAGYARAYSTDGVLYVSGTVAKEMTPQFTSAVYAKWESRSTVSAPRFIT